jgi:hypothetical protein
MCSKNCWISWLVPPAEHLIHAQVLRQAGAMEDPLRLAQVTRHDVHRFGCCNPELATAMQLSFSELQLVEDGARLSNKALCCGLLPFQ